MAILVLDSSVLIDLERGGLLEATFLCGLAIIVPDFLFENELKDSNGAYLMKLGLAVTGLIPDEMQFAQDVQGLRPALSFEDCAALVCAARVDHTLLAGDGPLRSEAGARKIECRGLLWLLDRMLESGKVSKSLLCESIVKISQDRRCRLPKVEVEKRRKLWCDDL